MPPLPGYSYQVGLRHRYRELSHTNGRSVSGYANCKAVEQSATVGSEPGAEESVFSNGLAERQFRTETSDTKKSARSRYSAAHPRSVEYRQNPPMETASFAPTRLPLDGPR